MRAVNDRGNLLDVLLHSRVPSGSVQARKRAVSAGKSQEKL